MSLKLFQIRQLLSNKREDFTTFDRETLQYLQKYRAALLDMTHLSPTALQAKLGNATVGAVPIEPLHETENGVIPCKLCWQNREQSLSWVRDRLTGVATFAVDGSQIYPSKDLSIPIALVQVGWFENLHLPTGDYEKDVAVDIMTPRDLQVGEGAAMADRRVNMRRFELEIEKLVSYMKAHPNPKDCLVFFDGSLVASFAEAFDVKSRRFYVDCLLNLLRTSEEYRVPLVAYIATSSADDLTAMLSHLFSLPESQTIHDSQVLGRAMQWGDRTALFQCHRTGILADYKEQRQNIAFTYLKTTREGYPARLELPMWMTEDPKLINRVMDWVRGEVIIGGGYPYVIETADQVAVLQGDDRQAFYRILQEWSEQEKLDLRLSQKMISKSRRR